MSFATPPLSILQAHALAGFCATSYVGILYVSQNTRISYAPDGAPEQANQRLRRRDDPDVIRARVTAVSLSTLISCGLVSGTMWYLSKDKVCLLLFDDMQVVTAKTGLCCSFYRHSFGP